MKKNDREYQLNYANLLKEQGLFDEAIEALQKIIKLYPNYAPAFNNLGNVFYAQKKWEEATHFYRTAIQKEPLFMDAYYNLGLALIRQNKSAEAITIYQQLLQHSPNHFAARFHLACLLMQTEKIDDAIHEFLLIDNVKAHFETEYNLATCYLKKGMLTDAKKYYQKALALDARDTHILFNLGVIDTQLGNMDLAIQHYQKAIAINPDYFAAHNNLGVAFLAKQHIPFALQHFKEAKRIEPNNASLQYTIDALSQHKRLLLAPSDYVKSLFDSYADHYEQHLLTALDYQIPAHFHALLNNNLQPGASLDILDLGCGTGLCGSVLKPFARALTGVDLSQKMLDVASIKNIYDFLICDDIVHFLKDKKSQYDVIVAGDVLVYFGQLENVFQEIQKSLRPNGLFIFNAEITDDTDYKMNQSGRFSHQKKYLQSLSKKNHFAILFYEKIITRMQNNAPVYGHLYVLRQTASM